MRAVAVMMLTPPGSQRYDGPLVGAIADLQLSNRSPERPTEETAVFRLVRFYKAFKRARQFGFTLFDAFLAARANSH